LQWVAFLLDHILMPIVYPALQPLQKKTFQLAKMPKNTRFQR